MTCSEFDGYSAPGGEGDAGEREGVNAGGRGQTSQLSLFHSETHCFWSNLKVSLSYSQISLFLHISHCGMLKISLFCTFTL